MNSITLQEGGICYGDHSVAVDIAEYLSVGGFCRVGGLVIQGDKFKVIIVGVMLRLAALIAVDGEVFYLCLTEACFIVITEGFIIDFSNQMRG